MTDTPHQIATRQAKAQGRKTGYGSRAVEYVRTAEMLVEIANRPADSAGGGGIYQAIQFLFDTDYDRDTIRDLLPILYATPGANGRKG